MGLDDALVSLSRAGYSGKRRPSVRGCLGFSTVSLGKKNDMNKLTRILYGILLVFLGIAVGVYVVGKRLEKKALQSLSDTIQYNQSIYNAASYAELLLYARDGNTTSLVQRLEHMADVSLLMASTSTNATVRVLHKFPWSKLKADRDAYPRQTITNREARISGFLDKLIKEQPQQPH